MTPISYQGPMEADRHPEHGHSQSAETSLDDGHPGLTVASILADKGDQIYTVTAHTTVMEVVGQIARLGIGALVVVDPAEEPIGIVSERDVCRYADIKGLGVFDGPVEDIMTADPKTCSPKDTTEDIMKWMSEGGFRHMPVMESGKLAGLISLRDVARHRVREVEYEYLKLKQAIAG
ncbi:MAG: CBS domain-containing protein [Pseudomonadota bacterium]